MRYVLLGALLCPSLFGGSIAIVNPSFELAGPGTPLTSSIDSYNTSTQPYGWTITQGNLEMVQQGYGGYWTSQDGAYSVDMNGVGAGNTVMTQTIGGFTPGGNYTLTFGLAANVSWCSLDLPCTLNVGIGGAGGHYTAGGGPMIWSDQTLSFTAPAATLDLQFTDTTNRGGNGGPAIDNVRITGAAAGVPEPASMGLLLLGGGALIALGRARR